MRNTKMTIWIMVAVAVVVVLMIGWSLYSKSPFSSMSFAEAKKVISDWNLETREAYRSMKQKGNRSFGIRSYGQEWFDYIEDVRLTAFRKRFGRPKKSKYFNERNYYYYKCRDGMLELRLDISAYVEEISMY